MRGVARWFSNGRERGQALVLFALGLAGFLGLVGMSVDVGQIVVARTDLQKMADASALAGSQDLPNPTAAKSVALEYLNKNGTSSCTAACIQVTTTDEPNDTITVTAKRQVNFTFLKVIGLSGTEVSAKAKLTSHYATGYAFDHQDVFPYAVWGGNEGGAGCTYGVCAGSMKIYRDNGYAEENVEPSPQTNPNWQVQSNKFKGYFHHGTEIYHVDENEWQTFSYGGNAMGQEPIDALHEHYVTGRPVILPVISAAKDCNQCPLPDGSGANAQGVQFKIVGWVAVKLTVDPANVPSSQAFEGIIVEHYSSPKGHSGGEQNLPPDLAPRVVRFVE